MTHYICKGENCRTVSDRPSVCLEPGCANRYKLLEDCTCPHRNDHIDKSSRHPSKKEVSSTRLNIISFGIAFGIVTGLFFFGIGLLAAFFGIGNGIVEQMSTLYLEYDVTLLGSFIGGLWGLVDGFIGGVIIAYVYNLIQKARKN